VDARIKSGHDGIAECYYLADVYICTKSFKKPELGLY
jgi:hypothetical protein